jgi:hypothetical protein
MLTGPGARMPDRRAIGHPFAATFAHLAQAAQLLAWQREGRCFHNHIPPADRGCASPHRFGSGSAPISVILAVVLQGSPPAGQHPDRIHAHSRPGASMGSAPDL